MQDCMAWTVQLSEAVSDIFVFSPQQGGLLISFSSLRNMIKVQS